MESPGTLPLPAASSASDTTTRADAETVKGPGLEWVAARVAVGGFFLVTLLDTPLATAAGLQILPAVEPALLLLVLLLAVMRLLVMKALRVEVAAVCLIVVATALSVARWSPDRVLLGAVYVFKPLLALLAGVALARNQGLFKFSAKLLVFLGLATAVVSMLEPIPDVASVQDAMGLSRLPGRAVGLLPNSNQNGQTMVLALCLLGAVSKRQSFNRLSTAVLITGVFLSTSRQSLAAIILLLGIKVWQEDRGRFKALVGWGLMLTLAATAFWPLLVPRVDDLIRVATTGDYFRLKALVISFDILREHLLLGTGVGSFGGTVANVLGSPVHESYGVFDHWIGYEQRPATIDMYWPHAWAELGLPLTTAYGLVLGLFYRRIRPGAGEAEPAKALRAGFLVTIAWAFWSMALEAPSAPLYLMFVVGLYSGDTAHQERPAAVIRPSRAPRKAAHACPQRTTPLASPP